jgi:hypothetical protein
MANQSPIAPGLLPLPHAGRAAVFTALFNFLTYLPPPTGMTWNTQSQYLQIWDDVPAANQPAMFLYRGPQNFEQKHVFGVTKLHWKASVWIYYRVDGYKTKNTYPDQITDQILDNLEQLFQTSPVDFRQTLGGLVYHCWIDGNVVFDPGIVDGQAVIVAPISLLL